MTSSLDQFEEFMAERYDTRLLRDGDNYAGHVVQSMWKAWQASRQCIEVELPPFDGYVPHIARELQEAFRIACAGNCIKIKGA